MRANSCKMMALALLGSSALVPGAAWAKDSVEQRLEKLEAMVQAMQARLDQRQPDAGDAAMVAQMKEAVAETRQVAARQDDLEKRVATAETRASGSGFNVGGTNVTVAGYVKFDAISARTSAGQVANAGISGIGRDFLIPSLIPVGGARSSGWDQDFSARQSRIAIKTATPVGDKTLNGVLEMDFMVTDQAFGDERTTNSYTPRLRLAYLSYGNWTIGQNWSTFQNVGALPDSLDFIGVAPGTIFNRQPQIRYTNKGLSIALEQPETTVTNRTGGRVQPGDDPMPDVVVRYEMKGLMLAGILRNLKISSDDGLGKTDTAMGYGASLSGKIPVGKDDIRFMATAGRGLGRYIGLNIVNDAAVRADGSLKPITTYSGFAAYRHVWNSQWRSSVAGSYFKADNPVALTGGGQTDRVWNALANIIYSPVPKLDLGLEYMYAERETEAGLSGNLQKVQMSAKYSF